MSLDDYYPAEVQPGHRYELSRGIIKVLEIPSLKHLAQIDAIYLQLAHLDRSKRGANFMIGGADSCKIPLADFQTERHPDVAIYVAPPANEDDVWSSWVPEVVIEVVAPETETCDYGEKSEEYLLFGVREYWILNADRREMLVLRRWRGRWQEKVIRPPKTYRTPVLPGVEFACGPVFQAARRIGANKPKPVPS